MHNQRGLLLSRDELRGWIASFDRYGGGKGGTDESNFLSMYDGGPILVDRKTGEPKTIRVPRAPLSVCGGIQPAIFQNAFTKEHYQSGLVGRFFCCMPPELEKAWTEEGVSDQVKNRYATVVSKLYDLEHTVDENDNKKPVVVELAPEAKAAFIAFYNSHNKGKQDLDDHYASAWSKAEERPARLALILELAKWAESGQCLPAPLVVSHDSMKKAIQIVEWNKHETERIYQEMNKEQRLNEQNALIAWIEKRNGKTTVRDLQRGRPTKYNTTGKAKAALDGLVQVGLGHWLPQKETPNGGVSAIVFELI